MVAENTTNEGWVSRQLHKVPPGVQLAVFAGFLLDWEAFRDHGVLFGLKASLQEIVLTLFSGIPFLIFIVACAFAIAWLNIRAGTLDSRKIGLQVGLFVGRLNHDRIANGRS